MQAWETAVRRSKGAMNAPAWQRAESIKEALVEAITGVTVRTDGVIELPVRTLLPGTTDLVPLQPVGSAAPVLAEVD